MQGKKDPGFDQNYLLNFGLRRKYRIKIGSMQVRSDRNLGIREFYTRQVFAVFQQNLTLLPFLGNAGILTSNVKIGTSNI